MFTISAPFKPTGDQPEAIKKLVSGLEKNYRDQVLLGVTGSGKTFTVANVIEKWQRPTLVISHNKTLAAQLYNEFKTFFPKNAAHYFVSYYDYYQPEAYIPQTDTYIEKDTSINEEIDRLRQAATHSILTRDDVIVVASVSCIYGIGNPGVYEQTVVEFEVGKPYRRHDLFKQLTSIQYERNDIDFTRGRFRVRGDVVEIFPAYEEFTVRLEFFGLPGQGETLEKITQLDALTGKELRSHKTFRLFPARHFVTPRDTLQVALKEIEEDLEKAVKKFRAEGKFLEAERIEQRTKFDLELIRETGFCTGIENYSRYFDRRNPGEPPFTLIDYFKHAYQDNWMLVLDESHQTLPQIGGMYEGDRSRKETLVSYGFRLPAALDNRPLKFSEFLARKPQTLYTSATPASWEIKRAKQVVEQLIRPTGIVDPEVEVKPTKKQITDLIHEITKRVEKGQRVLVTTLTKRMAEDLTEYLREREIKVQYLHSDVETLERTGILHDLRAGVFDVVVGINLLREGLDLPEVSLVAILDADKEGFLRSDVALIQTIGRTARHVEGKVIMYADKDTQSMKTAIGETNRRRKVQEAYNEKHGITPKTIQKKITEYIEYEKKVEEAAVPELPAIAQIPPDEIARLIKDLGRQMDLAAKNLEFEKAAVLRDKIRELRAATD